MAYRINDKLTFIHLPKNAGSSISKWIEDNTNYQYDGQRHQHISALPSEWQDNTFCVVRNPYERAVSWYYFVQQMLNKKVKNHPKIIIPQLEILKEGFEKFVTVYFDFVFSKTQLRLASHVMTLKSISQTNFIGNDYKGIVLRYENIHKDWKIIQDMIGCHVPLPVTNVTTYGVTGEWKRLYTKYSRDAISKIFKKDIEQFGYTFD
jgi:hypothetical protein